MVRLDVENSGNMIAELNLAHVFEPFFTTKPGGTGLGLAIARGIAMAHGGDLWVSGNRDGAVVFSMTIGIQQVAPFSTETLHGEDSGN